MRFPSFSLLRSLCALVVAAITALAPTASAQVDAVRDEPRLRGGVGATLGPAIMADHGASYGLTLEGNLGLQVSNGFAFYGTGSFGYFRAPAWESAQPQRLEPPNDVVTSALYVGGGILFELTIDDRFSIALGPEIASASGAVFNEGETGPGDAPLGDDDFGSELVGGRLRVVGYARVRRDERGPRRRSLAIGGDVRVLGGDGFRLADRSTVVVMPMFFVSHEWM